MVPPRLVIVVGMIREAKIVLGEGVTVLIGGGQSARLSQALGQTVADGATGVVSFGLCGALHPDLHVGDIVVDSDDPDWLDRLRNTLPDAYPGHVLGSDVMIASTREKARLFHESGADAVDMESHLLTAAARRAGIPYAIIRSVSDPANHALPICVLAGMKPDGETNPVGVLAALARRPWELPALLRTAIESQRAFEALARARARLGPTLGVRDLST